MPTYALDIIAGAYTEIGVIGPGARLAPNLVEFGRRKLNRLLDSWNAGVQYGYNNDFNDSYILIPNHHPHTIGPDGADFDVPVRPIKIISAAILLNNVSPFVKSPLAIWDDQQWADNQVPNLANEGPAQGLYYSPSWPNGELNIWPISQTAWGLELVMQVLMPFFAGVSGSDNEFSMPPAYEDAVTYTLAEALCPSMGLQVSAILVELARNARELMRAQNAQPSRISTADVGIPGRRKGAAFNWQTRSWQ